MQHICVKDGKYVETNSGKPPYLSLSAKPLRYEAYYFIFTILTSSCFLQGKRTQRS